MTTREQELFSRLERHKTFLLWKDQTNASAYFVQ
jgi:hypothetical protein